MVTRPRPEFLRALGLTSTIGLVGCQSLGQDTPTDSSSGDADPTVTETATETPTPRPAFKQNGTLYVEAADGPVGPDGFFD